MKATTKKSATNDFLSYGQRIEQRIATCKASITDTQSTGNKVQAPGSVHNAQPEINDHTHANMIGNGMDPYPLGIHISASDHTHANTIGNGIVPYPLGIHISASEDLFTNVYVSEHVRIKNRRSLDTIGNGIVPYPLGIHISASVKKYSRKKSLDLPADLLFINDLTIRLDGKKNILRALWFFLAAGDNYNLTINMRHVLSLTDDTIRLLHDQGLIHVMIENVNFGIKTNDEITRFVYPTQKLAAHRKFLDQYADNKLGGRLQNRYEKKTQNEFAKQHGRDVLEYDLKTKKELDIPTDFSFCKKNNRTTDQYNTLEKSEKAKLLPGWWQVDGHATQPTIIANEMVKAGFDGEFVQIFIDTVACDGDLYLALLQQGKLNLKKYLSHKAKRLKADHKMSVEEFARLESPSETLLKNFGVLLLDFADTDNHRKIAKCLMVEDLFSSRVSCFFGLEDLCAYVKSIVANVDTKLSNSYVVETMQKSGGRFTRKTSYKKYKNAANSITKIESKIMADVRLALGRSGVKCLNVHDAVHVDAKDVEIAKRTMNEVFNKHGVHGFRTTAKPLEDC